jgi:histidinol-phosphate/aromatic aminotransferase/cobyric acid decarboxylase-like protein
MPRRISRADALCAGQAGVGAGARVRHQRLGQARLQRESTGLRRVGAGAYLACADELGRYPDGGAFALRAAIAEHHGVDAAQVTVGNGSNDVLDLIARTFLYPGRESVFSEHAFAVYAISTQAAGATARVAGAKDFGHDLDALAALVNERTSVVWIANPNNPTGTWLASRRCAHLSRHCRSTVSA